MTTNTPARLHAVRQDAIEEVRTQEYLTLPSQYAHGADFLAECVRDGILVESEADMVRLYSDGLLTENEIDQIEQGRQVWQLSPHLTVGDYLDGLVSDREAARYVGVTV